MKLSIIIPVYNEKRTVERLLRSVEKAPLPKGVEREIIIVDDGSTDGTRGILKRLRRHKVIFHKENKGKGGAVRTGMRHATGGILIIQDADLEYDPRDYKAVIAPILAGEARVVFGSRRLRKQEKQHSGLRFYIGGVFVTWVTNILYLTHLTDAPTCYKAFSRGALRGIRIEGNRFDWEPEVTAKLLKGGIHISEVPIRYYPRPRAEGKKINWRDGLQWTWTLVKYRFIS